MEDDIRALSDQIRQEYQYTSPDRDDDIDRVRTANTTFALRLFQSLPVDRTKNVIIGPCLAKFPLLPLLLIAQGETRKEIKEVLAMENKTEDYIHSKLQYAYYRLNQNGRRHDQWRPHGIKVWDLHPVYLLMIKRKLLPPFNKWEHHIASAFRGYQNVLHGIRCVDQIGRKEMESVNELIEKETKKEFSTAIKPDAFDAQNETKLAMVSAVRFQGILVASLNVDKRRLQQFGTATGDMVTVGAVWNIAYREYTEDDHCQVLGLEFVWGNLTLYIFLPKPDIGLEYLEDVMTTEKMTNLIKQASSKRVKKECLVTYEIPEFNLRQSHDLTAVFRDKLGLATLFDPDRINLSTIQKGGVEKPSGVGGVFHHVSFSMFKDIKGEIYRFIRPSRESVNTPRPPESADFTADRPFLFVVYDVRANVFLLMGRVTDPSKST